MFCFQFLTSQFDSVLFTCSLFPYTRPFLSVVFSPSMFICWRGIVFDGIPLLRYLHLCFVYGEVYSILFNLSKINCCFHLPGNAILYLVNVCQIKIIHIETRQMKVYELVYFNFEIDSNRQIN